jgi:hypothetical protein
MSFNRDTLIRILPLMVLIFAALSATAQSGNAGVIRGTVADPTGAVIPKAAVHLANATSGFDRTTTADGTGQFEFDNVPFNPYRITVTAPGFATLSQSVEIRSSVGTNLKLALQISGGSQTVSVEAAGDLIENDPNFHADIDRGLFDRLPLESESSSLSSLVTLASPGIAADSNGLFHGLGDHAENSFSIDGQPVTDQVSKVFSNQIPSDSIQSMEVIDGAPPAEYGGKTSVVVVVTTRSGLGAKTPHGDITSSYGSFGSSNVNANAVFGSEKWGNFISLGGLNTSRFLDPPEFVVFHDKGNEENFFDRSDFKLSGSDALQLNLGFTRSWFQTPNAYDQQLQTCTTLSTDCNTAMTKEVNPITGADLTLTDQRSQIRSFNVSPIWTHTLSQYAVLSFSPYVRHDQYNYYPSPNSFSDIGPLQDETVKQLRFLTNGGMRGSLTYAKGIHNVKVGAQYEQTFLTENDSFAIVNPTLLSTCPAAFTSQCATLAPYDLTAGGTLYTYHGHTDVKELALYAQDNMTIGPWAINFGLRGDFYNGLQATSKQAEPRAGISYNIKKTATVLRVSYARTMESPFNENLVLSSIGCNNAVVDGIMTVAQGFTCQGQDNPLQPGFRNEFHGGIQQAFGKYFVLSGEYITKYTHNGYDFNVFGTSPITLPIEWHNSKIPGFALRGSLPETHGLSAFVVMSHVSARFFPPTVAGIAPPAPPAVFRIDHDEKFNETTHVQYQPFKRLPWAGFNWRYDSGLVAGFVPCDAPTATCSFSTSVADGGLANINQGLILMVNNLNGLALTADQEFQAGFTCNGVAATPLVALPTTCPATQFNSNLVKIPAPGTEQDDKNPQRIQPRSLFDASVGEDNLFKGDKYKWSLRLTGVNVGNKLALYNYLSTFSGTHYVTPRALTAEVGFHF